MHEAIDQINILQKYINNTDSLIGDWRWALRVTLTEHKSQVIKICSYKMIVLEKYFIHMYLYCHCHGHGYIISTNFSTIMKPSLNKIFF